MNTKTIYYWLTLIAKKDDTDIWIGDDEGHFVAKGVGNMEEGLLPGDYVVTFGELRGPKKGMARPITLTEDRIVRESDT